MKPPAQVIAFGTSGIPPNSITFTLKGGEEITLKLTAYFKTKDGYTNWDLLPQLLEAAARQSGHTQLIFKLP